MSRHLTARGRPLRRDPDRRCAAAYFAIFTLFESYDDEGTLLLTLKAFVHGDALYRDIYTPYGPFYYELFGGLAALTGSSITTDASRITVVVVWILTSGLYGLAAQRLTGRLLLGAIGTIVAFATLGILIAEPMHPTASPVCCWRRSCSCSSSSHPGGC